MSPTRFHIDLQAAEYLPVLERLHAILQPETYLEIGTRHGDSLRLARCRSVAVDPSFELRGDVLRGKPSCHFFQMTSDRFFRNHDAEALLGGKVEFAYIDGLHLAEFLLRDILNVEKYCRRNSIIVMHDCLPSDIHMACRNEGDHGSRTRSVVPGWWTGDVWKAVWALQKHRPDLRIVGIDSPPTGLVCLTNLDPSSTTLERNYCAIVDEMTALRDEASLQCYIEALAPIKPSALEGFADIARYFHL